VIGDQRRRCAALRRKANLQVTEHAQNVWFVMLQDEAAAGRIIVPLKPFVRFHRRMSRQLARLERRIRRANPQLARRGALEKIAESRRGLA
jgi:hypothetical protein